LAIALLNLAARSNSRDLPAALEYAREAIEVSRRAGLRHVDGGTSNYVLGLWTAGQLSEASAVVAEARSIVRIRLPRVTIRAIEGWLAEAYGDPIPALDPDDDTATDEQSAVAW
jgi:hypothetical protein